MIKIIYVNEFFLTPDRKKIISVCIQSGYCYYNIETNKLTGVYSGNLKLYDFGIFRVYGLGNWPSDEKDLVLLSNGEEEPSSIWLLDTRINTEFVIWKSYYYILNIFLIENPKNVDYIARLAWFSKE